MRMSVVSGQWSVVSEQQKLAAAVFNWTLTIDH
jgi:hypothetical protein